MGGFHNNIEERNTIIEAEGLEAWEVERDVSEGEEVPSREVVEVPSLVVEASRIHAALLRAAEVASRALEVFLPWREGALGGSPGDLEAVGGGA